MPTFRVSTSTHEAHIRWETSEPYTEDMLELMDVVRDILSQGMYYSRDVREAVIARYAFTEEEITRNNPCQGQSVEGGVLGMDIYYARKAIERLDKSAAEAEARKTLQPIVGMKLGACAFPGQKTFRNCEVIAVGPEITLLGTKGGRRYRIEATCARILAAQAAAQQPV